YAVSEGRANLLKKLPVATYCFFRKKDSNFIFAGTRNGLTVLEYASGGWRIRGNIENISEAIRTIAEDRHGNLWLGTAFQGLTRVEMNERDPLKSIVHKYNSAHGLPEGMAYTYSVDEQVKIGTYRGLYRFDDLHEKFVPDSSLGMFLADTTETINQIVQDRSGNVWLCIGERKARIYRGVPEIAGYYWQQTPFQRLDNVNAVMEIFPEESGIVWIIGRNEKIYRYDSHINFDVSTDYAALVRRIGTIPQDSVIWNGFTAPGAKIQPMTVTLPYQHNSLRFQFSATSFDESIANQFQIKLDGYDPSFLPWTTETRKDYTGLPAGEYTFFVKAKNIYGTESQENRISIKILPPWYQKWWAYVLYVLLVLAILFIMIKLHVRRYVRKAKRLERIVDERTQVIREQAEKLRVLDRAKSRFFANISHEFRTPLSLIMGPLEDMLSKSKTSSDHKNLELMHRNANRILQLINQLLDLSRLESGKLKLQVSRGDFEAFLKGIVMSFASLAEQKQIDLQCIIQENQDTPSQLRNALFDRDVIEKIFYNLLSNAFKFTSEGGCVHVTISNHQQSGFVEIHVKDNGIGIEADQLENIFDRFYQVSAGTTREYQGTGIGLALTKELVELHHGSISVKSEIEAGTEFVVSIPVVANHFSEAEITDASAQTAETRYAEIPAAQPASTTTPDLTYEIREDDEPIILVVDDHPDVRNYIRGYLESDFQVVEATNGEDGMAISSNIIPDMIISDVMMPKMDGFQFSQALKQNEKTSHIPIILLTAKAGEQDRLSGLETGADDYLTKPFNSKELHVRVRNLIELRQKLQQRFHKEALLKPRHVHVSSVEDAFINKLMSVLEENLGEEGFGVEQLSKALYMGRRQLHRKIKAITGETPTDFIRSVRLTRAKQLLEQKAGTVSEIALETGFSSLPYFSTAFKNKYGISPSEI
ncbi:response regulator, partial [candidate division KSB1 bacterium]|nr:response regulator [candidate division KSB1 bacterium]